MTMTINRPTEGQDKEIRAYTWSNQRQMWRRIKTHRHEQLQAHLENLRDVILPPAADATAPEGSPAYRWADDLARVTRFLAGQSVTFNHRNLRYVWMAKHDCVYFIPEMQEVSA